MTGPLDGIRIFDWTGYGVGPFSTSVLGALGADVIKIEQPPGEVLTRSGNVNAPGGTINGYEAFYLNFNMNKQLVMLNLKDEADREKAFSLLRSCDVFMNNLRFGVPAKLGFTYEAVRAVNPKIIYCISTGWGSTGPMAPIGGSDGVCQCFCGWTSITGAPGGPGEYLRYQGQIDLNTSIYIAAAILQAIVARDRTGLGQEIEISMPQTAIAMQSTRLAEYLATGAQPPPMGSASATTVPHQAFRTGDNVWLAIGVTSDSQWQALCSALQAPELAADTRFATNAGRVANRDAVVSAISAILANRPVIWWTAQLTRHKVPHSRFWDFETILHHPQVRENAHMIDVDTGKAGVVHTGGPPWKFARTPARMERNPWPDEDRAAELTASVPATAAGSNGAPAALDGGPLAGVRVVEIAQGIAGPYCGALLADGGADVVKVEPPGGDSLRAAGPPFIGDDSVTFVTLNRNKRGVTADAANLDELIRWADVVIADWGDAPVSYEQAAALNPKVVHCSLSPYGEQGPYADMPASELVLQAMSNIWAGLGVAGEEPRRLGADKVSINAGVYAFQAILASLHWRERTGEGQRVAVSALGGILYLKGMHWVPYSNPDYWPSIRGHGGHALRVFTDPPNHGYATRDLPVMLQSMDANEDDFRALLVDLGIADEGAAMTFRLADDPRKQYGSLENQHIWEAAFANHTAAELDAIFARHNWNIIPYNNYDSLFAHPQMAHLDMVREFDHPTAGTVRVISTPWRYSATPESRDYRPAPLLGQHNHEVAAMLGAAAAR